MAPQKGGLYEITALDHMNSKVDALYQKIENISIILATHIAHTTLFCETSKVNEHFAADFQMVLIGETRQDYVNYINNNQHNNPYSSTYNPWWRNLSNF